MRCAGRPAAVDGPPRRRPRAWVARVLDRRGSNGKKRTLGPSAASAGDGFVYVGNRATSEVCAVDAKSLALGKCVKFSSGIDVVGYVARAREVWVTEPKDDALVVLDARGGVYVADSPGARLVAFSAGAAF